MIHQNKIPEIRAKMARNVVGFEKMAPNFCRKTHEDLFLEVISKKGLHDLCWRIFAGKSRTKTFRASLGKFGRNPSQPQKFACSYTYAQMVICLDEMRETVSRVFMLNHCNVFYLQL